MIVKKWYYKGLKCEVTNIAVLGNFCGYVSVPYGYNVYGKDYNELEVYVHGGLTYGNKNGFWWEFGFDCAHAGDLIPAIFDFTLNKMGYIDLSQHKWTVEEVEIEVEKLAEQLYEMEHFKAKKIILKWLVYYFTYPAILTGYIVEKIQKLKKKLWKLKSS